MKQMILWQKWENPYEVPTEEGRVLEDIPTEELEPDISEWYSNEYEDATENVDDDQNLSLFKTNTKAILTPMGMIPINERTACTKTFKFWIGHTNFTLSEKCQNVIENTDGVEILDIFTRYRFRVAIGKAFQDRSVMQNIQTNLYEKLL
jgi:hypothetical protein